VFITLIITSEVILTATAVWIFKEDGGIWPASITAGWQRVRAGSVLKGAGMMLAGGWDIPIIDLRLRSTSAIAMARVNRVAALVPLGYALIASANKPTPWGLRSSALADVGVTFAVWAFMELVMVQRTPASPAIAGELLGGIKQSRYYVRRVVRADIPRLAELEQRKWRDQAATRELIENRIRVYPQGQIAAVHESVKDGTAGRESVVAWITVMSAREAQVRSFRSWNQVTSDGTIDGCDPRGNVIVGVNLTSVTEGATYLLLGEVLACVVGWGKAKMIGGGRLNGFVAFNEHRAGAGRRPFAAEEYAHLREVRGYRLNERRADEGSPPLADDAYIAQVNGLRSLNNQPPLDEGIAPDYVCANIRGYMSIPGAHMVEVVPDYFDDAASDNWGVVIDWTNPLPGPLRHVPLLRNVVASRIRSAVRAEWDERALRVRESARRRVKDAQPVPEGEPVSVS
jgi:hypothetical protein